MWDYGFTFFLTALESAAERDLDDLKNAAVAARVGFHADQKAWRDFMNQGRKRTEAKPVNPNQLAAVFGAKIKKQGKKKADGGKK